MRRPWPRRRGGAEAQAGRVCPHLPPLLFWDRPPPKWEEALLKALVMSGLGLFGVVAVACGASDAASNGSNAVTATLTIPAPAATPTATPGPAAPSAPDLTGFAFPLAGACLPQGDQLMPNAPRPYRNGIHEGVDFYAVDNCTAIARGTPVLAAKAGRVIRADLDYHDLTPTELKRYEADPNTEEALDAFRGRQVWIEHEGGVVTRYAHLSGIAPGIRAGATVQRGQVVAYVGESGTPESVTDPGHEYHLHFEVRVGSGYLGQGLPPAEVRRLYRELFGAQQ
jgi:murein DD-endopeptidase MepM/ murein hydrolase activator NlpD